MPLQNLVLVRLTVLVQEMMRLHHKAGRAEAAGLSIFFLEGGAMNFIEKSAIITGE